MKRMFLIVAFTVSTYADEKGWTRHTIDQGSKGADGVRLSDVNGDGLMDIATGWEEGGVVRAYLHPGRGKEKALWPAVTVGKVKSAEDAVFVDLNNDGVKDVVSSCEGGTKSMFVHWAPARIEDFLKEDSWKTEVIPVTEKSRSWMYALPMQIDGKGGTDLFVGSKGKNGCVGWLEVSGDVSEWKYHHLQDAGWIMSLIATDMDGDGDQDLLVSDRKGAKRGIYWLEYPGAEKAKSEWKRHEIGGDDREILFISTSDIHRDGKTAIIAIDKKSIIWFTAGNEGNWGAAVLPLPEGVGGGKSAVSFDINLDGANDFVFSCEGAKGALSGVRWLSWDETQFVSHEVAGEPGEKYDRLVPYDVDGDGDLDLLCCEERDQLGVFWYENPFAKELGDRK
ncbi:MAG: FG-GAP repeat domain-containing protein [Akkermansiaceae bacterium]